MHKNHPSRAESEEDELAPFAPVLAVARLDAVPEVASSIWDSKHPQDRLASLPIVGAPLHGSYNILFPVEFSCQNTTWLLKIPINGTPTHWNALSANELESEARTMQLIRQRTSIPIPEVFGFCNTLDNPLHCPHIWLSFIPGISLHDFWFANSRAATISEQEEDRHRRRTRVLQDVASAMVQLSQFTFKTGGRLLFSSAGSRLGIGPRRELDTNASSNSHQTPHDSPHHPTMPVYVASGPYKTPHDFYTAALKREEPPPSNFLLGQRRLLELFIDCTTDFFTSPSTADTPSPTPTPFVLTHPDFSPQNFLISPQEGRLVGILDWDGVGAWPASLLGNLRYPGWLTRDWDPGMYGYGSDGDGVLHDSEMTGIVREDSPRMLARLRGVYRDAVRDALGSLGGRGGGLGGGGGGDQPGAWCYTSASLVTENLAMAVGRQMGRGNILRKIVREIGGVVEVPCVDKEFLYMELCDTLGRGEAEEETLEALRVGLRMLLCNEAL